MLRPKGGDRPWKAVTSCRNMAGMTIRCSPGVDGGERPVPERVVLCHYLEEDLAPARLPAQPVGHESTQEPAAPAEIDGAPVEIGGEVAVRVGRHGG
jgi:hypothetical protein